MTEVNKGDLVQKGESVTDYLGIWTRMGFDMTLAPAEGSSLEPITQDAVLHAVTRDDFEIPR